VHNPAPSRPKPLNLRQRPLYVMRPGVRHRLDNDRVPAANGNAANFYGSGNFSTNLVAAHKKTSLPLLWRPNCLVHRFNIVNMLYGAAKKQDQTPGSFEVVRFFQHFFLVS
jgi:hypothetical protein